MCGIAGYLGQGDQKILQRMTDAIIHRGPDDCGFFVQPGVGLGMRRLSIIDLAGGKQPMFNAPRTVAVVYNGEIYNFKALRQELERAGYRFTTESDTEVIVHGYEEWGAEIFSHCNGMFAIAIWDCQRQTLLLARDRLGKKPLYWGWWGKTLVFGSEPKALLQHPAVKRELDWRSLAQYLVHEYVPTPRSIYAGMRQLPGGAYLTVARGKEPTLTRWWDVPVRVQRMSAGTALARLDALLEDAVKCRLIADVPLGVFLSGGIDSSTVAYYAQKSSARPVKTFSIGFVESSFDESAHARHVANFLGTDHAEQILRPSDALELVPKLADFTDEPLADPSLIPTRLLAKFARQQVTVALGGDGGDELFFGYPTFQAERLAEVVRYLPLTLRRSVARAVARLRPRRYDYLTWGDKLKRFWNGLTYPEDQRHAVWRGAFAPNRLGELLTPDAFERCRGDVVADPTGQLQDRGQIDRWQRLSYWYLRGYLQDDVLVKVDRASMYASLEVRAPLLDYRVVELVVSLPPALRFRGLQTKYLLKRLMADRLPPGITHRRKQGFAVPIGAWLRQELKPLALDVLSPARLKRQGIFQPAVVEQLLSDHLAGKADNRKELWTLMCFQLWHERWAHG